jgi:secreted Zn-dependent insulinase-like peptidase
VRRFEPFHPSSRAQLGLTGYTDKLPTLLRAIVARLANLAVDPQRFAILKEQYRRYLVNFKVECVCVCMCVCVC